MRDCANSPVMFNKKENVCTGEGEHRTVEVANPRVKRIVLVKSLDPDKAKSGRL
jgi:hypothetical protein